MGSRYVGQLGRYAGQSRYELARIETYEVAMQASQAVSTPLRGRYVYTLLDIYQAERALHCFQCF